MALLAIILTASMATWRLPMGATQDNSMSYKLLSQTDSSVSYTLSVLVSQSLYEYYTGLSHEYASDADFSKFVTPYAVKPVAEAMRQVYPDDEDFANGVLTLVHQIPYEGTVPAFYPVETLVKNKGDCDMLSLLAASILQAGGLQVILFHYYGQEHMNIGVRLASAPEDAKRSVYCFENGGEAYYVAETTSTNWTDGWRVGECPSNLQTAPMQIIALYNSEKVAPEQVSVSLERLEPATSPVEVSPTPTTVETTATVTTNGQITPTATIGNITPYITPYNSKNTAILTYYLFAEIAVAIILTLICIKMFFVIREKKGKAKDNISNSGS